MLNPLSQVSPPRASTPTLNPVNASPSPVRARAGSAPAALFSVGPTPSSSHVASQSPLLAALHSPGATAATRASRLEPASVTTNRLLNDCSRADAEAIFDSLPAVHHDALVGTWRGAEVSNDHPLSGLLPAFGWYGKRFESSEAVHPLVFNYVGDGSTFSVNPAFVPMSIGAYVPRWNVGKWLMTLLSPIVSTRAPKARLRQVEYRGVVSAAMVYDQLPIIDVFRKVDDNTLLGAMDYRAHAEPFYFLLRRQ